MFLWSSMVGFVRFIVLVFPWWWTPAVVEALAGSHHTLIDNNHVDAATMQIFSDIMKNQISAKSAVTSSSPECWMNSINTIHTWAETTKGGDDDDITNNNLQSRYRQYDRDPSGSSFFASMTMDQQEIFALELTHCQLMKANRPLYDSSLVVAPSKTETTTSNPMEVQGCAVGMGTPNPYLASSCFPLMSEYAFGLYNTMFLHTREVRASLTEERIMQQKEIITHLLVGASAAVSQQMQNVLGEVTSVSEKLNEHYLMIEDMTTQTTIVFEQLQSEVILMAEHHKAHEQTVVGTMELMTNQTMIALERVQEEVTIVIAEQQKAHEHATAMVLEKVELETAAFIVEQHKSHQRASELHIEEITQQTARILERMQAETATVIAVQADKIKEQDYVIERMNELLVRANEQMKPLSSIEFVVKMAEDGYAALKIVVNFILSIFTTWMITTPPLLRLSRRYFYLLFSMSLIVEMAFILWLPQNDLESSGMEGHRVVRTVTRLSAVVVFLLSPVISCFSPPVKADTAPSVTVEDLVKVQMDLLAKFDATIQAAGTKSDERILDSSNATKVAASTTDVSASTQNMENRSYQSPAMKKIAPVVTPTKLRAEARDFSIANPTLHNQSTIFYPHGFALEYMLDKGNDGDCSSSGDDSSLQVQSSPKRINKRTVYSSGSDEANYFSAKDEEMSDSTDTIVDASPMKKRKEEEPNQVDDHEVRVY